MEHSAEKSQEILNRIMMRIITSVILHICYYACISLLNKVNIWLLRMALSVCMHVCVCVCVCVWDKLSKNWSSLHTNWNSTFPECFLLPCKFMTGETVSVTSSIHQQWWPDTAAIIIIIHVCVGLVVEYWPIVGTMDVMIICVISLLCIAVVTTHSNSAQALPTLMVR